jgi:hypothetical protein
MPSPRHHPLLFSGGVPRFASRFPVAIVDRISGGDSFAASSTAFSTAISICGALSVALHFATPDDVNFLGLEDLVRSAAGTTDGLEG